MDNLDNISDADLEALLEKRRKEKVDRERKAREEYENRVNKAVGQVVDKALNVHNVLNDFYHSTTEILLGLRELLDKYGEIKSTSKGGFSRKSADGKYKVVYRYTTSCDWDERAEKAEGLLRDFLKDFVKKRDIKMYNIISALLERNKEGNLEYSRIQSLYSKRNEFDDPRWKEAIRLFEESYNPTTSKMRIEVYQRNEVSQSWEPIRLNLSNF